MVFTRAMTMDNLRRVDLNLLVTLETLLTERSVTRAAKRLHLSQPSVSVQLREMFSDPLLSPAPGGMLPTTRAQAILLKRTDRLQILSPPLTAPFYDMASIWHERSHVDTAHAWLREQFS